MNLFTNSLKRVLASVHSVFNSDEQLNEWVQTLNSERYEQRSAAEIKLKDLMYRLDANWLSNMLINEERQEVSGVIAEAIIAEVRHMQGKPPGRSIFSYQLASRILNKGIRPLNRTARNVQPELSADTFLASATNSTPDLTEEDLAHFDEAVETYLKLRQRSNIVATAKITLDVKNVWEEALAAIDAELGSTQAKPMSNAVKKWISKRLDLPVSTIEAAMKRYKRAVAHVRLSDPDS